MARRGKFGRLPRAVPSLTSTIVSIAREMQAERDKNIMSAWQNGGEFEGKPATDEVVLAYWKGRLKGVDKNDPLYDTYSNAVSQYEYAIAESKMSTKYAQGKIGEGAMAKFYTDWAKKVPQDSEFYRVLQRDAAQFMRAAKARGAAGAAKAKEQSYQDAQALTAAKYEKVGLYLTDQFRNIAKANALIGMDNNQDFGNFDPSDPSAMLQRISLINSSPLVVLYHDPLTGKPVTGQDILNTLKTLDPHFTGTVTTSYFTQALRNQLTGQAARLKLAQDTGHKTDINNIQGWQQYTSEVGREANAWPIEQTYLDYKQTFLDTWSNALATPTEKLAAWKTYQGQIVNLAHSDNTDDATSARLIAEASGNGNISSLSEDFTGLGSSAPKEDIAGTAQGVARYEAMQKEVDGSEAVWAMGVTKNGVFTPAPGGREIGAATPQDIQAASQVPAVPIQVPDGSATIEVWAPGISVTATATDPGTGQKLSFTSNPEVAQAYDVTINGQTVRIYAYKGGDGHTYYTNDAPWGQGVVAHSTAGGIELDLSKYVPKSSDGSNLPQGVQVAADQSGAIQHNPDGSVKLEFDPNAMTFGTDPFRNAAGPDHLTDSFSPTVAAVLSQPNGFALLEQMVKDPAIAAKIDADAHSSAGQTLDPTTGAWVGGDAAAYATSRQQVDLISNAQGIQTSIGGIINSVMGLFNKDTTAPTFQKPTFMTYGESIPKADNPTLPSDSVRGTQFAALGHAFNPQTNKIMMVNNEPAGQLNIKTGGELTVPAAPKIATPTITPPAVTTTPAPSVTTTAPPSITSGAAPYYRPGTTIRPV